MPLDKVHRQNHRYGEASPALEHLVLYDDGSSEWLTLKNEKVRYVQATARPARRPGHGVAVGR